MERQGVSCKSCHGRISWKGILTYEEVVMDDGVTTTVVVLWARPVAAKGTARMMAERIADIAGKIENLLGR